MSNKSSNKFEMIFISILFVLASICACLNFALESAYKSSEQGVKYCRAKKILQTLDSAKQSVASGEKIVFDSEDLKGIENETILTCIEKVQNFIEKMQNSAPVENSSKFVDSLIQKAITAVNSELDKPDMKHFTNNLYMTRAIMVLCSLSACFCFVEGIRQGIIYIRNKSAV